MSLVPSLPTSTKNSFRITLSEGVPQFLPDRRQGPLPGVTGGFFVVVLLVVGGKLLGQLRLVCATHVFLFTVSVGPTL